MCLLTLSLAKKFVINLMSANNANPILRRLGIKGELSGSHFNGGRSGKSGSDEELHNSDIVRLLVKIAIKEEKERRELDFANNVPPGANTSDSKKCSECKDSSGRPTKFIYSATQRRRYCMDCWDTSFKSRCKLEFKDEEDFIVKMGSSDFLPNPGMVVRGLVQHLNNLTRGLPGDNRTEMKVVALKLEAMKQIRGDCSSVGKTGYDVPNIGTTNWSELVELIESAHSFVSVLYNSTSDN